MTSGNIASEPQHHEGKPLPRPDADFYDMLGTLAPQEQATIKRVRAFLAQHVAPIIQPHWSAATFPFEIIEPMKALGIGGLGYEGYGCAGGSTTLNGFVSMELARVDPSISTFWGVHSGLAMGSIYLCGSEEQKRKWLPPMARMELIGAFGLTEPDVGSGAAGGLTTTARRDGDHWVLNGQKKWIGNATFSDLTIIWARDEADGQVKGFIVEKGTPGFVAEKIEHKLALRVVQNALITLTDCRVAEADRLQETRNFKDTADVLRMTRAGVAWQAVGCAMGAYEHALAYAQERQQFGKPIAGFQLVQDLLVRMLGNITASLALVHQLSRLQDAGTMADQHASLAKVVCTTKMRETVGYARELMGGNGILVDYHVARFVADAEAIYSYEGTREMNTLIVGRAITGLGAFV
ncbi:Acyl-CoA dehydrogenase [Beijerinckiaceae bacterium RH AL1]|nr:acyl-CoA dehydrogenase family protein [Beijerinckiaceae bacterium]VVB49606.1 Acyl-CoA dehydrogenase [Beijerinckiaceae bacterium RH CH11]VVB49684.1 Acyl-CoA dehydrogenase [Beijerinckiaceae bacterium RH AL8]VVC56988.1 Acyl-CoA dehydrogenase [Beijerinckiaceae bacterium RH AL1]